jgi:hypothetical protein
MKYKERDALVAGLREFADWIETNPRAIELPSLRVWCNEYVYKYSKRPDGSTNWSEVDEFETRLAMRNITKILGSCKKDYVGGLFSVAKNFGPVKLSFHTSRSSICRKVVKETIEHPAETRVIPARTEEVVEWVCDDPILA